MTKKKRGKSKKKKSVTKPQGEEVAVDEIASEEVDENGGKDKDAPTASAATTAASNLPPGLEASLSLFTPKQQILVKLICSPILNQSHLFEHWASEDVTDDFKISFVQQLESLDQSYASHGLAGYIKNAKVLLEKSKAGVNPLEGWKPTVPVGQAFQLGSKEYNEVEAVGLNELGSVGFVLVAGGLGERLGYSDIKIGLPTEMATETKYLQFYIEYILALQKKYAPQGVKLPLCIMTSADTNAGTVKLLKDNDYFGMQESQITLVQQGEGVPALMDNDARIALDANHKILTKPHGHGDVHALLYSEQVAKKWHQQGIRWISFFQDTNGLAFHTLPLTIGVSKKFDLVMNSLAVPRKAKQAIGAITKLVNDKQETRTINVEYNQLDPLLRATGHPDGDEDDPKTGLSPYPGNINQLLFHLKPYLETLERTKGAMPEFVNPKYKDAEKTVFKKPTRLECMMQDFPTVFEEKDAQRVGFTSIAAELCFSPVKNATVDGVALQKKGTQPGVAASGEADQYAAVRAIMRSVGCTVDDASPMTVNGISFVPGPQVVLKPDFVACPADYKVAFPCPEKVRISSRSSLVVNGSGIVIESLELDGALEVESEEGAGGVIRDLSVINDGWALVPDSSSSNEIIAMRGYVIDKKQTRRIVFRKDGSIDGDYDPDAMAKAAAKKEEIREKAKSTPEPIAKEIASSVVTEDKSTPPVPEPPKVAAKEEEPAPLEKAGKKPDPINAKENVSSVIAEATEAKQPEPKPASEKVHAKPATTLADKSAQKPAAEKDAPTTVDRTSATSTAPHKNSQKASDQMAMASKKSVGETASATQKGAPSLSEPAAEEKAQKDAHDCGCYIL